MAAQHPSAGHEVNNNHAAYAVHHALQQQQQQQQAHHQGMVPPVQGHNNTAEFFLSNYRLGRTLGIGSFGKVCV